MDKQALLLRIDQLRDPNNWDRTPNRDRRTAQCGPYTLLVDPTGEHALWQVEHEDFGVILPWTPSASTMQARTSATEFCRAHILGHHQPQHA